MSIGNLRPGAEKPEEVNRIKEVAFFALNTPLYDDLGAADGALPSPLHMDSADSIMRDYTNQPQPSIYEHPCSAVTKIFSSGTFYYTPYPVWDLSSRLSQRIRKHKEIDDPFSSFDERFVWNEYVAQSLMDFRDRLENQEREELDRCQFIVGLLLRLCIKLTITTDPSSSRLCWNLYSYPPPAGIQWVSDRRNCKSHIKIGMETRRYPF